MTGIDGIDLILNPDLKRNLLKIKEGVIEIIYQSGWDNATSNEDKINKFLYENVMGVGCPISICDGQCWLDHRNFEYFYVISMLVDYRVTYGYKPYQELDKPINLSFTVSKSDLRNRKLSKIGI